MIPVIVPKAFAHYAAAMASALIRLLTLIALVAMPFGMAASPALAEPDHQMMMAGSGHCDAPADEENAPLPRSMDCAAACAAIVASPTAEPGAGLKPESPRATARIVPFTGIVLEIATPPPRLG